MKQNLVDKPTAAATIRMRPHYHLVGNNLFFLASARPLKRFTEGEKNLFNALKNASSDVGHSTLDAKNFSTLETWVEEGLADIFEPLEQASAHHLVVIEPHMDDAILSAGGQLLLRKETCKITILCVFGVSNYTSYMESKRAYLDATAITQLRHAESELAATLVGADFLSLGFLDAPLRMQAPAEWSEASLAADIRASHGFIGTHPMPHLVTRVAHALARSLEALKPDEVWMPMGLGNHIDHKTTRAACLQTLSRGNGLKSALAIRVYEDLPYSRPAHRLQILKAFEDAGAPLAMATADISGLMAEKMNAVGAFASQFKLPFMAPRLAQAAAEVAKSAGFAVAGERYYHLQRPFQIPDELALSINRDVSTRLKADALNFSLALAGHKSLTVLGLPSGIVGAPSELTAALSSLFPNLKIEINLIDENKTTKPSTQLKNISIRYFSKKSVLTAFRLFKVLLAIGQPLVVVRCDVQPRAWLARLVLGLLRASRPLLLTPSLPDLAMYWELG